MATIEASKGDDEGAHGMEDDLYIDLLSSIAAKTCSDPVGCAVEALKARQIHFARWCA